MTRRTPWSAATLLLALTLAACGDSTEGGDGDTGIAPQDAEAAMEALEELADRAGRYAAP